MSMYLLTRRLSKEQFVATGAWFFFTVNLAKVPVYHLVRLVQQRVANLRCLHGARL